MKTRVEIETQTFVRFWLVVVGFFLAGLAIYSAAHALVIIGAAFFLALALNKPVSALANRLPGKSRVAGTAIAFITIVSLLGAFLFLVIPPIIEQSAKVAQTIPSILDSAQRQWVGVNEFVNNYGLQDDVNTAIENAKSKVGSWAAGAGSNLLSGVGSIFGAITSTVIVLVLAFLMLIEAPSWLERLWSVYSDEKKMKHHRRVASRMYNVVTGYVTGQLAVSGIGAFFAGLTVFILSLMFNVPNNLALPAAAISFVLSLIPMFGSTIAGILISVLLAFNDISAAVVFAIYFVIYQQIENNFISPTIQSKAVELSALAILSAITIGVYVFGFAGAIISIPIAGCIKVLLEDHLDNARKRRTLNDKPLHKLARKIEGDTV